MSKKTATITGAAAAAAGVAVVAVGGFAVASFMSGGGTQPEDIMPANTIAFVKVDMDPAAGQKVNVYKLAKKFESVDAPSADDLKDSLLSQVFADSKDLIYDKDIKPWLGDRAALAVVPHTADGGAPLAIVEFTDEKKMTAAMEKFEKAEAEETDEERALIGPEASTDPTDDFAWAVRDNFLIISTDQETADAAAKAEDVLGDDADFTADVKALGGDQIVTAWVDLAATYNAMPEEESASLLNSYGLDTAASDAFKVDPTGSLVMGVNAQSDHIEFVAKSLDVTTGVEAPAPVPGTGMVTDFPADTVAALSVSGLGQTMTSLYDTLAASGIDMTGPQTSAAEYGLVLPDDLAAFFGTDLAAGITFDLANADTEDEIQIFGKVRTDAPDRAMVPAGVANAENYEDFVFVESRGDHYVAGSSPEALALPDAGGLGDDPQFKKVVVDPSTANSVGFVDIARLVDEFVTPEEQEYGDVKPLDAFGFSVSGDAENGTVIARLSVR